MRCVVSAGLVACLVSQPALASIVTYYDQTSFTAATPNAIQFIFSGPDAQLGNSYTLGPATFASGNVSRINGGLYSGFSTFLETGPPTITLSPSTYGFGLMFGTIYRSTAFSITVNGVQVTTVTPPGPTSPIYVGFVDTDPIATTTWTLVGRVNSLDVLDFATSNTPGIPVPEPASLLILGVGASATTALQRRGTA